jgi:type I restriction enzyme S subunit
MSAPDSPAAEEIRHLDDEWRQRRRRIDVLAGDSALDDDFLTYFKAAYHHLKRDSPVEVSQFFPPLHAMLDAYHLVRPALDQLTQLHRYRDHSAEETRCCYPAEARALARDCLALLGLMRDSRASLAPHVEPDYRRNLENRFDRFEQRARDLVAALEEGAGFAEQLQAQMSGSAGEHDRAGGKMGGGEGARRDLKPGYKQTEVGVIPEDWEVKPCSSISSRITVGIVIRPTQYYAPRGVPALRSANVREAGIDRSDMVFISHRANQLLSKSQIRAGDVLTVRTGYPGTSAVVPKEFHGANCIDILITTPSSDTDPRFLTLWINSPWGKDQVLRNQGGLAQKHFNVGDLRLLNVAFPTLTEQEAIAGALSDADALIDSLEQLIAKKRLLKQGAMQDLLTGKRRLPGFEGEWEVKTFGEIFAYLPTATNSRSDLDDGGDIYYIHYGDIHTKFHNHLDFSTSRPPRIDRNRCRNAALLKNGDWVMADASEDYDGVGKTIEIQGLDDDTDAIAGLHTFVLREKSPTYAPGFKGHLGNVKSLHQQYLRVATGMKVYGVSKTALRDLELPVPTLPEQTAIAAILSDMDLELAALEAKMTKARQVKQGMMQELLTGKTRLV